MLVLMTGVLKIYYDGMTLPDSEEVIQKLLRDIM
jgi:hypothetical protein